MTTENEEHGESVLRRTAPLWRMPDARARGELVWNADGVARARPIAIETEELDEAPPTPPVAVEPVAAARTPEADPVAVEWTSAADPIVVEPAPPTVSEAALRAELEQRRAEELALLGAELAARRDEMERSLARQRADAEERIASAERLEREAMARRREQADRLWSEERGRMLAERIDEALAIQLAELKTHHGDVEALMRAQLDQRRREEEARLEAWRVAERERVEAELAAEERRFNERLMWQLREFEVQLGERMHEQEGRLAAWWTEAERVARERVATLLDRAFASTTNGPR